MSKTMKPLDHVKKSIFKLLCLGPTPTPRTPLIQSNLNLTAVLMHHVMQHLQVR